ncbi:hypothetical protein ACFY0A_29980 [Streptomyces sp. NPDC001698]|uniref:hypothetical protein n=1 Tax=Streptomyces sp. NPDC001698 TaxID=3364601 RepID=UPI0036BE9BD2
MSKVIPPCETFTITNNDGWCPFQRLEKRASAALFSSRAFFACVAARVQRQDGAMLDSRVWAKGVMVAMAPLPLALIVRWTNCGIPW